MLNVCESLQRVIDPRHNGAISIIDTKSRGRNGYTDVGLVLSVMLITIGIVLPVILFTQSNNVITLVDPGHESGKVVMFACCDHPESCRVASGIQLYSAGERCVLLSTDELWGQLEIFKDYDQFSSQYCVILEEFVPAYGPGSDT